MILGFFDFGSMSGLSISMLLASSSVICLLVAVRFMVVSDTGPSAVATVGDKLAAGLLILALLAAFFSIYIWTHLANSASEDVDFWSFMGSIVFAILLVVELAFAVIGLQEHYEDPRFDGMDDNVKFCFVVAGGVFIAAAIVAALVLT